MTLHSTYGGAGQPVNTLTVTASITTSGEKVSSAPRTITVTDPPATVGAIALLGQYAASSFVTTGGGSGTTPVDDSAAAQPPSLAPPQHG